MIEFVYGNHGTGKTEYIYESLKKDASAGIRSFLIVPEQAAVSTEKQALERLPDSAQLTFEVLNFSRMSNRVFREYGGITYKTLSPGTKKVLMMRALSKTAHLLGEYEEAAKSDKGFPDLMLKTVKELGNCGLPFEKLEKIAASAKAPLASKLSAVLTCAAAFKELSKGAGDTDSDTEKLADCLEKNAFFKGSHVYIDSFSGLTGVQHRIIKSIFSQADRTVVSVPLPSPSHRGADTVSLRRMSDRLRADAAATGLPTSTLILDENKRASHGDLALVADGLWDNHTGGDKRDGSVSVITAENIFDEAEFAAGLSRKLIEDGMRCRDIVLVSRNPEAYKGIIDAAFEEAGVPFWISDKQPLSLTSPARLVLSALRIIEYGWLREDVTSHLRTGLCGIDSDSADIFVAYADKWRISGKGFTSGDFVMNPSGYEAEFTEYDRRVLQTANKVRKEITSSLSEFGEAVNAAEDCRGICRAIYSYLLRLDIKDRLLAEATLALKEGRRGEANELAHTFSAFTKALEELSDAYGDAQKPSVHEFTAALAAILEASEIGSIPASSDAVTFSSADLLRAESPACVMLLGVKDGTFPATPSGRGLLSDEDRSELMSTPGISLSDRTSAASNELYYFRRAAAQASDKLFIFRTKDTPSVPVSKIRRMLPGIDETVTSDCPEIRIASRSVAKAWLPLLNGTAVGNAVSELLGKAGEECGPAGLSAEAAALTAGTVKLAYGKDMLMSQSQLELYLDCPFKYACEKILRLGDSSPAEFSYAGIGTYVHAILERYLKEIYTVRGGVYPPEQDNRALLASVSESVIDEIAPPGTPSRTGLVSHLSERLRLLAAVISDDVSKEIRGSDFLPEHFELEIGPGKFPPISFPLSDGGSVSFIGKVDRIDVCRRDGVAYIKAVDYKTGSKEFRVSDIADGKNLQLLLYMLSLTKDGNSSFFGGKPKEAAFEYLSCNAERLKELPETEAEAVNKASETLSRSGIVVEGNEGRLSGNNENRYLMKTSKSSSTVTEEEFKEFKDTVSGIITDTAEKMKSGYAAARPSNGSDSCRYCSYSGICRSSVKYDGINETED